MSKSDLKALRFSRVDSGWTVPGRVERDPLLDLAAGAWKRVGLGEVVRDGDGLLAATGMLSLSCLPGRLVLATVWVEDRWFGNAVAFMTEFGRTIEGSLVEFDGETELRCGYSVVTIRPHVGTRIDRMLALLED
jgi:hypothetical protein